MSATEDPDALASRADEGASPDDEGAEQPRSESRSTPPSDPPAPSRDPYAAPPSRLRRFGRLVARHPGAFVLGVVGTLAAVPALLWLVLPAVRMHMTWSDSAACVARFEQPRGRGLPNCASYIRDYEQLADYRLTHHDATYRAEELWARIMMASYLNAAIGAPNPAELARTAGFVEDAQGVLARGSQRISLDELGPAVMAPNRGKLANAVGDRTTLLGSYDAWTLWSTREDAIRAALLEANVPLATVIASDYAASNPREADLRTTIGAVLCLGTEPAAGIDVLERVPTDRYDKRYASIQRNYGEVLGVLKACSRRAGRPPPPLPTVGSAGVADVKEARLVELIRLTPASDAASLGDALDRAVMTLQNEEGVDDRASPWARAYLLAALLARDAEAPAKPPPPPPPEPKKAPADKPSPTEDGEGEDAPTREGDTVKLPSSLFGDEERGAIVDRMDPKLLANLARPRTKETELAPRPAHVLSQILDERVGVGPILPADLLAKGADRLEQIAERMPDAADPAAPPIKPLLLAAAGSIAMHAGIAAARLGAPSIAEAQMARATRLLGLDAATGRLLGAAAIYVAGDRARALAVLGASGDGAPAVELESALLRARLVASDDAELARAEVRRALDLASRANDPRLTFDARWMDLALAPRGAAEGPLALPVYTGQADVDARAFERYSAPALDASFRAWRRAIDASPEEQLAFRYKLFHQAGDAPDDLGAYLVAGARLLPDAADAAPEAARADGGATEVWLDAMTALDRDRATLFAYAFARAEAARLRGDTASAARWSERVAGIRAVKADVELLEIARFLHY